MSYVNLIDGTSTTPSGSTPGVYLNLTGRSRLSLAASGVPVRMRVFAESSGAGDTGAVKLVDSTGADVLAASVTGDTERWYLVDGFLPATDAKYDLHFGGNLTETLTVHAVSLYEWYEDGANNAVLSSSIGTFTLAATGTSASPATWSTDATSGKGVPADGTEWTALMAYAGLAGGNPSSLYLCQEASGNLADTIGSDTLTATGSFTYQHSVAGWTRKGILFSEDANGQFESTTAGPDPTTDSSLWLIYAKVSAVTADNATICRVGVGFDTDICLEISAGTAKAYGKSGANTTLGSSDNSGAVRPYVLMWNRAANTCRVYTDQEKITVTPGSPSSGTRRTIGGVNTQTWYPPTMDVLYSAVFTGSAAEMSDASVKTLLTTLGWSPPWS